MRVLVDTNILGRLTQLDHPQHQETVSAVRNLRTSGHELRIVPQVLYEFWCIATKDVKSNGLGLSIHESNDRVNHFITVFVPLRDERGILAPWHRLVFENQVQGKKAHDAHLVAAMHRHELTHILTFNGSDFKRFSGIEVLDPLVITKS